MVVYNLDDFMILIIKGIDYRCYMFNMSKNDVIKLLNNSVLMDFRPNITPIEVIKKQVFGGNYFKDIYSSITDKWYKNY